MIYETFIYCGKLNVMNKLIALLGMVLCTISGITQKSVPLPDLQIKEDKAFFNNKPFTGNCYEYFTNGRLKYEGNYKNGIKHGWETTYYDNGQKRLAINYNEGVRDGDCGYQFYTVDGQLRSELDFEMGEKIGFTIYPEMYYYPVIVGEKNGALSRNYVLNNKTIEVKILKTYNQYFNDKGIYNYEEFPDVIFPDTMAYATGADDDILFLSFRMKGKLPIYPPQESIYDHIKYNAKSTDGLFSVSMKQTFKNMLLRELTLEEVYLRKVINNKNIVWELPPRVLLIAD